MLLSIFNQPALFGKDLEFGIKSGISLANMYGDGANGKSDKLVSGLNCGGLIIFKQNDDFEIQAELILCPRGVKRSYSFPVLNGSIAISETIRIWAIHAPVIAKFPFPRQYSMMPSIYFGSSLGIALSGRTKGNYDVSGTANFVSDSFDGKIINYRKFVWDIIIGGDVAFNLDKTRFLADVRYGFSPFGSFSDVDRFSSNSPSEFYVADLNTGVALNLKNSSISMAVGIIF